MLYFGCFDGIFWGIMASFGSYIIAMALDRGYSQGMVSIMVSGYLVSAFAGQFFWANLCDRLRTNKRVFILGVCVTAVTQILLYLVNTPWVFAILYIALGFTLQPMGSVLDAWMLRSLEGDVKAYAPARGGGSIGYAVTMLGMGKLIARLGYWIMPVCASLFAAVTLAVALAGQEAAFPEADQTAKLSFRATFSALKNGAYLRMLAVVFLLGMAIAPVNNFKISILKELGGDVSTQGLDGFFSCVAQFAVFEAGALLARIPAATRLLGGAVMLSVSVLITANASNCASVIAATMLVGSCFGVIMPAGRERILKTVDARCQTTAIGLMDGCYSFLGGTIAMLYAGTLAEAFGLRVLLAVCAGISLVPVALIVRQSGVHHNHPGVQKNACCVQTCGGEGCIGRK